MDAHVEKEIGLGLWLGTRGEQPLFLELRDLRPLVDALGPKGEDVLHAFLVIFNANERLCALGQLMELNDQHVQMPLHRRNNNTLAWMTIATFREALKELRLLEDSGVGLAVGQDYEPWQRLRAMKTRWENDKFVRDARNIFSAHLGRDEVRHGLRMFAKGDCLRLLDHSAGYHRNETIFPAARALIARSLGAKGKYTDEQFQSSGVQARNDAFTYGILIELVFLQVLRRTGKVTDLLEADKEAELLAALTFPTTPPSATSSELASTDAPQGPPPVVGPRKKVGYGR